MTRDDERYCWVVTAGEAKARLDRFLTQRGVLGTRSQVQRLIADGLVRLEGRCVKAGTVLQAGQQVCVARPIATALLVEPEAIDLQVLHEDECLLVINKPPGLVVHPAPGHRHGTLVNALLHRWRDSRPPHDLSRSGIAHRLDKDTSGVIVVAKDVETLADLGRQFRRREITKQYLALVWGNPRDDRGVIDEPIGRHPVQRKRMTVRARGREAVTRYEVLERLTDVSLIRAYPETGRTHQIRVHLAAIGHPIVADATYARGRARALAAMQRHALHAEAIALRHPQTGERVAVVAPLATDFAAVLELLGSTVLTSQVPLSSVLRNSIAHFTKQSGTVVDGAR